MLATPGMLAELAVPMAEVPGAAEPGPPEEPVGRPVLAVAITAVAAERLEVVAEPARLAGPVVEPVVAALMAAGSEPLAGPVELAEPEVEPLAGPVELAEPEVEPALAVLMVAAASELSAGLEELALPGAELELAAPTEAVSEPRAELVEPATATAP